jgi:hypothetical protein
LTINSGIRDRVEASRIYSARYAAHAVSLIGGGMVRRAYRQRSLIEVLLPDADKLWDPTLRRIDTLLDDEALVDRIAEALTRRHPQSQRRGRLGTPAAVVLRMLVLKHLQTGASMSANGRCAAAWSIARSAASTANVFRTRRR